MFEDDIILHRREVERNINASFGIDVEKARLEGDITTAPDGKKYIWARTAPGSATPFAWHVYDKRRVIKGKGYKGEHGIKAVKTLFSDLDKAFTDPDKMTLKRTPNGNWRLIYDNNDAGNSVNGDMFTSAELEKDGVCYQSNMVVDNFKRLQDYMEFTSPDDVYFVQIIKRWKDNKDKPGADAWKAKGQQQGTYHSGAEYMNYYLIHSHQELMQLKPSIVKFCQYNNARAYMSINTRNERQTNAYIQKYLSKHGGNTSDPRYKYAEPILYGQAKSGDAWKDERFKVLVDIDIQRDATVNIGGKVVNVWDETRKRLKDLNIKVATEYETPSGGLHLILNNKNNRNLKEFYKHLSDFDGGRNLGKMATVHPTEDAKLILYSNVETEGY